MYFWCSFMYLAFTHMPGETALFVVTSASEVTSLFMASTIWSSQVLKDITTVHMCANMCACVCVCVCVWMCVCVHACVHDRMHVCACVWILPWHGIWTLQFLSFWTEMVWKHLGNLQNKKYIKWMPRQPIPPPTPHFMFFKYKTFTACVTASATQVKKWPRHHVRD